MKRLLLLLTILLAIIGLVGCNGNGEEEKEPLSDEQVTEKLNSLNDYGLDLFQKGDYLPLIKNHIYSEQTSSYSRNGNNVDGFGMPGNETGEVSSLSIRRPLLILNQPGIVYRMWFTNWADVPTLFIIIDGEEINYRFDLYELTGGENEPFVKELVFNKEESSGGYVSYVPLIFKKSIEIYGRGDFYFNINFQKYPHGYQLEYDNYAKNLQPAVDILKNVGSDPKFNDNDEVSEKKFNIAKNETYTLYEANEKQTVTALNLRFPNLGVHEFDRTMYDDKGHRIFRESTLEFDLNAKAAGSHQLKFRGVLGEHIEEIADVYINGSKVDEIKFRRRRIGGFEWKDDPFFADSEITINLAKGGKFRVKLVPKSDYISVYNAILEQNGKQIDFLDFGNNEQEKKRELVKTGLVSPVSANLEYDPNTLIDDATWTKIHIEEDIINKLMIKITYDNLDESAVYAPISSFFGFGQFGMFKTLGLMVGLRSDGWMYSYYPMPFEKGIKIELINNSEIDFSNLEFSISTETNRFETGTYGYFKTKYTENLLDTPSALRRGEPIDVLTTSGHGHVVGLTHSQTGNYFGLHSRYYLEGDEQIYIDGSLSHSFHGTGTEDLYNGGWYFKNGVQATPLFGQSNHNYRNDIDRTVMIRTFFTDPIYFRSGIDFKLEHGGNNDRPDSNVYLLTYYYHLDDTKLFKTDTLVIGDDEQRLNHNYKFDEDSEIKDYSTSLLSYEGLYSNKRSNYQKMAIISNESSFEMSLFEANEGAILRREYLMEYLNQMADVYVDGELVGTWSSPQRNAFMGFFVRQDDFVIDKKFTQGKSKITIKLVVKESYDSSLWSESFYEIYSIVK